MLSAFKIILILRSLSSSVAVEDEPILIKLDPKRIINTFKSLVSVEYLEKLADEFAMKAAQHFIEGMKNNEKLLSGGYSYDNSDNKPLRNDHGHYKKILDDREAMTLLHEPSPDGDNLSLELSDQEIREEQEKKTIPVIEFRKINGVYYRRLLGR